MNGHHNMGQPRIYEDRSEFSRALAFALDRFENEGGLIEDTSDYQPPCHHLPRNVRSIQDGQIYAIALESLAEDTRGWWVDLDARVVEDGPEMHSSPLIRRPDRTGGEYEVSFERCPSAYLQEPTTLPSHQSWCRIAIVPDTHVWGGVGSQPTSILGRL